MERTSSKFTSDRKALVIATAYAFIRPISCKYCCHRWVPLMSAEGVSIEPKMLLVSQLFFKKNFRCVVAPYQRWWHHIYILQVQVHTVYAILKFTNKGSVITPLHKSLFLDFSNWSWIVCCVSWIGTTWWTKIAEVWRHVKRCQKINFTRFGAGGGTSGKRCAKGRQKGWASDSNYWILNAASTLMPVVTAVPWPGPNTRPFT